MKSFTSYITEAFNKPYKWQGPFTGNAKWLAKFHTDSGAKYVFVAASSAAPPAMTYPYARLDSSNWEVTFSLEGAPFENSMGITGTAGKEAFRIFATVRDIFIKFAKDANPESIIFTAEKDPSADGASLKSARSKIYTRFAKEFARKNKYKLIVSEYSTETEYYFKRKSK
jgi:hypothetical protein